MSDLIWYFEWAKSDHSQLIEHSIFLFESVFTLVKVRNYVFTTSHNLIFIKYLQTAGVKTMEGCSKDHTLPWWLRSTLRMGKNTTLSFFLLFKLVGIYIWLPNTGITGRFSASHLWNLRYYAWLITKLFRQALFVRRAF